MADNKSASTSNLTYTHTSLVTSKPPLAASAVGNSQLSPRLQSKLLGRDGESSALPPLKRGRGHTISVMSPAHRNKHFHKLDLESVKRSMGRNSREPVRYGSNPSAVFLSLFHSPQFGGTNEKPILVSNEQGKRAISNLDWIPPYETHKVGVLYVGPGQGNSEQEILRNQYGSIRYMDFLQRLGTLIKLTDADPLNVFLGGLETNGSDGKYTYSWQDEVMQVIFHVATMMPTLESDPNCNNKKKNIGNDYVTIVYNESGVDYNIRTVKVRLCPVDYNIRTVKVRLCPVDYNIRTVKVRLAGCPCFVTDKIDHNSKSVWIHQNPFSYLEHIKNLPTKLQLSSCLGSEDKVKRSLCEWT
ncbi:tuberin [Diaphorina citri]|uniref:Tuberin n=1 Tax=Diaphorina citri TaxID=121845 RepID=A0A1S3DUI2_DIACI|nr:tuberin [Diaphorina citri]